MKPTAIRLLILCVLLVEAHWIRSLFHPADDFSTWLLAVPWFLLMVGMTVYAGFALWRLWTRPRASGNVADA
jgi:hypothetical protein